MELNMELDRQELEALQSILDDYAPNDLVEVLSRLDIWVHNALDQMDYDDYMNYLEDMEEERRCLKSL